jgi:hypothetical protein
MDATKDGQVLDDEREEAAPEREARAYRLAKDAAIRAQHAATAAARALSALETRKKG